MLKHSSRAKDSKRATQSKASKDNVDITLADEWAGLTKEQRDAVTQMWVALYSGPLASLFKWDLKRRMNLVARSMILVEQVTDKQRDMLVGQCQAFDKILRLEEEMPRRLEEIQKRNSKQPVSASPEWLDQDENV